MTNEDLEVCGQEGPDMGFSDIVIGTSLTVESDAMVHTALAVCRALGARYRLIHVTPLEAIDGGFEEILGVEILASVRQQEETRLARQISDTGVLDRELIGAEVVPGSPHQVLVAVADRTAADLIIIGARDGEESNKQLLGSTADRLIRSANCPVLLVRSGMVVPPTKVLTPVDFSPTSARAVDTGVAFLSQMTANGVTTIETLFVLSELTRQRATRFSPQQVDRMAKEELLRFTFQHTESWHGRIETKVRVGEARHQLLRELEQFPVDLIVVGSHGHGRLHRALIGSVAGRIARQAACSVLFVPRQDPVESVKAYQTLADTAEAAVGAELARGPMPTPRCARFG